MELLFQNSAGEDELPRADLSPPAPGTAPRPSAACLSLPDPSGSSTMPASLFSCLKKPEYQARRGRDAGRSPSLSARPGGCTEILDQREVRAAAAGALPRDNCRALQGRQLPLGGHGKLGIVIHIPATPKLGVNTRDSAWLFCFRLSVWSGGCFQLKKTT